MSEQEQDTTPTETDTTPAAADTTPALTDLKVDDLRELAKARGIAGTSKLKRDELLAALDGSTPAEPVASLIDYPEGVRQALERSKIDPARIVFTRLEDGHLSVGYRDRVGTLVGSKIKLSDYELAHTLEASA